MPGAKLNILYRQLFSKMVAALASYFGLANLALAEDLVQETFITAYKHWSLKGIPDKPDAWLFRVCKNKALNAIAKKQAHAAGEVNPPEEAKADYHLEQLFLDHEIKDSQLRLLFACCHHHLSPKAQVVLILKNICGLKVDEIARALAMTTEAVTKMCTRSRQTLTEQKATLHVPFLLQSHQRLNTVHTAIYLLFNEGYQATTGNEAIRKDLCLEAIRLAKTLVDIPEIRTTDTYALLALLYFHVARFDARTANGELIDLENQDREKWDRELIALGTTYFKKVIGAPPSRFILEAAIASTHCTADTFANTNWNVVKGLYSHLQKLQSSPFVDLNYATATFYSDGPDAALSILQQSPHIIWIRKHYLYYTLLGKIFKSQNNRSLAIEHYNKARSLTNLESERKYLQKQIDQLM